MAYIELKNDAPGIIGLKRFRPEHASALNLLAETVLRGPSTLSPGDRELIAACVSYWNHCKFCYLSHSAVAQFFLGQDTGYVTSIAQDIENALIPDKLKSLLTIAKRVTLSGNDVTRGDFILARYAGATDTEIHDTILITSMFCMYNRYVDGLGADTPEEDSPFYDECAKRLAVDGYMPK